MKYKFRLLEWNGLKGLIATGYGKSNIHLVSINVSLCKERFEMNRNWIRIGSVLATLLLVSSALYLYSLSTGQKSEAYAENSQELPLARPAFLGASATYLEQEAGISYYVNTTGPLNLNTAKSAMVNIENVTSDYVIGSLAPSGFSSDDYPHCFVHKDGWIVVYYLKINLANPATTGWLGKIIDWSDRSQISFPIISNLLYDGLYHIATQTLGISITNAKYYHFQYPTATKLLFAMKHAPAGQTATFNIQIPDTLIIHERSWSCYSTTTGATSYTFKIDTTQISRDRGRHYGGPEITEVILGPNIFHTVSISADNYVGNYAYVCLVLLYH